MLFKSNLLFIENYISNALKCTSSLLINYYLQILSSYYMISIYITLFLSPQYEIKTHLSSSLFYCLHRETSYSADIFVFDYTSISFERRNIHYIVIKVFTSTWVDTLLYYYYSDTHSVEITRTYFYTTFIETFTITILSSDLIKQILLFLLLWIKEMINLYALSLIRVTGNNNYGLFP